MESSVPTPDPARPSSAVRRASAPAEVNDSSIVAALPAPDPSDETPTMISLNRSRSISSETIDNLQGKQLGHFELIEPIGVGGMAAVIRAKDLQLGRIVALKILPPEMAVDPENINRFKQEARAAAKLDHENVARVYFCGEDQGLHFIAFEFVEGDDLRTIMNRGGPLSPTQAVKYMLQIAAGLAHAGSRGVVHRDIKPSNIIITPEGRAKIVDMGLARTGDAHGAVTQSGVTLGTFDYISPEQAIEPRAADIRSDIYSLGCTFYHLMTGQPPVPEGTAAKKLHHHQHIAPVDPRELNPAIPDELVAILSKMMAKEPRDRYQRAEHLIQHLMAVAHKLQLPGDGSGKEAILFVDAPLPQPSRFSPVLAAAAAIAAVTFLAVVLGMGGPASDPQPVERRLAKREGSPTVPSTYPAGTTGNGIDKPVDSEPKKAATIDDLARLLEQKVDVIELTGDDYNLASLPQPSIDSELHARSSPLTVNRSLKIIGKGSERNRPVLRWKAEAGPTRDAESTLALLNIVASTSAVDVELRNLRFEVQAAGSDFPVYAVAAQGTSRLSLVDCEFVHEGKPDSPYGGAVRFEGIGVAPSALELERCWFVRGACAIDISNRGRLRARQCAFGPHEVVMLFSEKGVPAAAGPERVLADLSHCSIVMREGTVFHAEANVSGTVRATDSLFARAPESGEVVLMRQKTAGQRIQFTGPAPGERSRNVYHGITFWANPSPVASSLEDCRRFDLPFHDNEAVELPTNRPPWKTKPLDTALDRPVDAFTLNTARAELRTLAQPAEMIGVQRCAFGSLYTTPLTVIPDEQSAVPANVVIIDPTQPRNERQRTYKSLTAALADAPAGELTALIRHTGTLDVEPIVLARPNLRLTIRPDAGFRPIITLAETDAVNPAIFTVHNGTLSFRDIQFRLLPRPGDDSRWVSVATITGGGQCSFEDCVATLDSDDDTQSALVVMTTADMEMSGERRAPKVRLTDCFVRGRGHLVTVRGSRPFDLEAENTLAVLKGSLVVVNGQTRELPAGPASQIVCRRVTAYLADSMIELRAAEAERKVHGIVPMQVKCEDSLIVAASDHAVVHANGIDRDTVTKSLLTWEGVRNIYGNFQKWIEARPNGTMMMATEWTPRDWLQFTRESEDSLARVSFTRSPADDAGYTKSLPADFRAKLSDMKRSDVNASAYGAAMNQLPRVDDE